MIDEKIREKMEALQEKNIDAKRKQKIAEEKYQMIIASPIKIKILFYLGIISLMSLIAFVIL